MADMISSVLVAMLLPAGTAEASLGNDEEEHIIILCQSGALVWLENRVDDAAGDGYRDG